MYRLLLLALLLAPSAGPSAGPGADEVGPRVDPGLGWEGGPPRVELFAVEWLDAEGEPVVLGVARHLAGVRDGGRYLAQEQHWFGADLELSLVERPEGTGTLLVWRERSPHGGRTLVLDEKPAEAGTLFSLEWGSEDVARREWHGVGFTTPLAFLEELRHGRAKSGTRVFDPLTGEDRPLGLHVLGIPGTPLRFVRLTEPDGTLAARYLLAGDTLLGWQLQEGGPVARAVAPRTHEALRSTRGAWDGERPGGVVR
jgi:hypothetical protein